MVEFIILAAVGMLVVVGQTKIIFHMEHIARCLEILADKARKS